LVPLECPASGLEAAGLACPRTLLGALALEAYTHAAWGLPDGSPEERVKNRLK